MDIDVVVGLDIDVVDHGLSDVDIVDGPSLSASHRIALDDFSRGIARLVVVEAVFHFRRWSRSPLGLASRRGARLLVDHLDGVVALDVCSVEGLLVLIDHGLDVRQRAGDATLIQIAARDKRRDLVEALLAHGADVGDATLVEAVSGGDLEIVKLLVEAGADVNEGFEGFPTPLGLAKARRRADIESYLLTKGATELVGRGVAKPK